MIGVVTFIGEGVVNSYGGDETRTPATTCVTPLGAPQSEAKKVSTGPPSTASSAETALPCGVPPTSVWVVAMVGPTTRKVDATTS